MADQEDEVVGRYRADAAARGKVGGARILEIVTTVSSPPQDQELYMPRAVVRTSSMTCW